MNFETASKHFEEIKEGLTNLSARIAENRRVDTNEIPQVEFSAFIVHKPTDPSYPPDTIVGGIAFEERDADVRLNVIVNRAPIRNLDFTLGLDKKGAPTSILGVGQISQFPGVTCFSAIEVPTDVIQGPNYTMPITPIKIISPLWRVHCNELFRDSALRLVIEARVMIGQKPDWRPRRIDAWGSYEIDDHGTNKRVPFEFAHVFPD